jgi:hypothetical protein
LHNDGPKIACSLVKDCLTIECKIVKEKSFIYLLMKYHTNTSCLCTEKNFERKKSTDIQSFSLPYFSITDLHSRLFSCTSFRANTLTVTVYLMCSFVWERGRPIEFYVEDVSMIIEIFQFVNWICFGSSGRSVLDNEINSFGRSLVRVFFRVGWLVSGSFPNCQNFLFQTVKTFFF